MHRAQFLLVRYFIIILFITLWVVPGLSQTKLTGSIYDLRDKEKIPHVSIRTNISNQHSISDSSGYFQIEIGASDSQLIFSIAGYDEKVIAIDLRDSLPLIIYLNEAKNTIDAVDITRKVKYNRKNPAAELIDLVIQHKRKNMLSKKDNLYFQQYEKIKFGLVDPNDFFKNKLGDMSFFFKNVDTSSVKGKELLTLFMEEKISDNYTKQNPSRSKKIITLHEKTEFNPKYINNENIHSYINYLLQPVDIYDESIFFINKQFLSPIADNAKLYYKYYLLDTITSESILYARLRFEPFNKTDLLFSGDLIVSLDGKYAVKNAKLRVDGKMNLNWVNGLDFDLSYSPNEDGIMLQDTTKVLVMFGRGKTGSVYGERTSLNTRYNFKDEIPSGVFVGAPVSTDLNPNVSLSQFRPIPLRGVEQLTYFNVDRINKVGSFNTILSLGYLLAQGYHSLGKFELGPLEYTYHNNNWEGSRFRLGGRTTPAFSTKTYLESYVAYGTRDQQFKYFIRAVQSLNGKSVFEFPAHYVEGSVQHDVLDPGRILGFLKGDSFFQGFRSNRPFKWLNTDAYRLGHMYEFGNHLSIASQFTHQRRSPLGDLRFPFSDDPATFLKHINTNDVQFILRWAPREKFYYRNMTRSTIRESHPVFSLQYNRGLDGFWDADFKYDALRFSVSKRWFLNQVGFGDMTVTTGKIWGALPYPLLEMPTVQLINDRHSMSFELVNSMEFVADQFVKFSYDHQFQGFILNKIPYIKWFKLREIWGTRMFYGQLSDHNNPYVGKNVVAFDQDEKGNTLTHPIGRSPYLEGYVGLDNILKIFRVQYFYRYNYLNNANIRRERFRLSLNFDF